jgi:hypothetical protein
METFWMVWNENDRGPQFKHFNIQEAYREAERIALICPGSKIHVLQCLNTCQHNKVNWEHPPNCEPF